VLQGTTRRIAAATGAAQNPSPPALAMQAGSA